MKPNPRKNPFVARLLAFAMLSASLPSASGANYTWDTVGGDGAAITPGSGDWNGVATNWNTGVSNVAWSGNNTAVFAGADGAYAINLASNFSTNTVLLNFANSGYEISASSPQSLTTSYSSSTSTSNPASATTSLIWVAAGKSATLGNNVTFNSTGTSYGVKIGLEDADSVLNVATGAKIDKTSGSNRDLIFGGLGTVNVAGTVTRSVASDSSAIIVGQWSGNTTVMNVNSGGVVSTASTGSTNSNGSILVGNYSGSTGTLNINAGATVTSSDGNAANAQSGLKIANASGSAGTVNLNGGTLTTLKVFNGAGTGTFNFNGGTLAATGNTTEFVSGLTEVNVRNGGALINTNGFDVTIPTPLFHSNIGGDSATDGGLVKNGSGTLTLDFDNSGDPYTGATIVNGGTLSIGSSGYVETNVTANSGSSVGGTGTLAGSLTTNAGSALTNDLTGPLLVDGAVDFAGATGLVFTDAPANGVTYDLIDYTFGSVSNVGNLASTTARVTIGNTGSKITGTVTTGTRTWSTTSGTWEINGAANFLEGDQKFFNGDTVVFNNPAAPSTVTLNGNLVPVSVSVTNTNDYTFAGAGSITGTAVLTKAGGGNLTIGNSNAHTGGTTIDGGSISISGSSNLGDASGLLTINAGTLKVTADVTSTRAVSLGNAASTIEVDPTFTYSAGTFSGTGNLTKTGSGTLAITGSPSHTGSTLVSAGALRVANGTFSGGTGVTTNASLEYDVTSAQTETAAIGGTGTLTRTGSNILTLANQSNSYTGQTIITGTGSGGTLAVAADEVIPDASELVLSNGGKLQLGLGAGISSTETIAGLSAAHSGATLVQASESGSSPAMLSTLVINTATATTYDFGGFIRKRGSADVSITKSGPGTQILSNTSNSYTGVTTINAGTLQLGNGTDDGTIGSTSGVVNNGTLAFNNTGSRTANYVISGTGSVTKSSGGTMTLNGVNTYTGDTVINAGTLAVNGTSIDDSVKVDIVGGKMALTNTETVNSLYFGGVEQASGTWGATGSGATHIDDARFSGTGVLSVTTGVAGSPYDTWSGGAAFDVDTNGDGVTNGMAWLLGAASPSANAVGLLPVASQSGGGLVLTFNCLNAANRGTAVLNVGHSSDLGILDAWTYAAVTDVDSGPTNGVTFVVTPGSPTNAVTATISSTEGAAGKLFGHLKGTK